MKAKLDYKRAPNFTAEEIDVLVELVCEYIVPIESSIRTLAARDNRKSAWEAVMSSVNAVNGGSADRSIDQIKKKWSALRNDTINRFMMMQSGSLAAGGQPIDSVLSDTDMKILDYLGIVSFKNEDQGTHLAQFVLPV